MVFSVELFFNFSVFERSVLEDISWVQKRQESSDLCLQDGIGRVSRSLKTMENCAIGKKCFFSRKRQSVSRSGRVRTWYDRKCSLLHNRWLIVTLYLLIPRKYLCPPVFSDVVQTNPTQEEVLQVVVTRNQRPAIPTLIHWGVVRSRLGQDNTLYYY